MESKFKKNSDVHDGYVVYNGEIIEKFKILGFQKIQDDSNRRRLDLIFVNSTKKGKRIKFTHDNYPNSVMYVDDAKLNSLMWMLYFIKKSIREFFYINEFIYKIKKDKSWMIISTYHIR